MSVKSYRKTEEKIKEMMYKWFKLLSQMQARF